MAALSQACCVGGDAETRGSSAAPLLARTTSLSAPTDAPQFVDQRTSGAAAGCRLGARGIDEVHATPAWRSRMIVPRTPDARRPGPSGPDRSSPSSGSCSRATLASADRLPRCQLISSLTASGRFVAANPAGLGRVRGRAQSVRAHLRDRRGLSGRSGGSGRCRAHITCGATSNEPAANLFCDVELAAAKSPRSDDGVPWPAIAWSFSVEQPERSFRAVSRPYSNDSSFGLAQCLRRTHIESLPSLPRLQRAHHVAGCRGRYTGLSGEEATGSQPRTGWP